MNPKFSHKHKFRRKTGECPGRSALYSLKLMPVTGYYSCRRCGLNVINTRYDREFIKLNPCIEVIARKIHEA